MTPSGKPADVKPINNGMDEQEQKGVTVPSSAAAEVYTGFGGKLLRAVVCQAEKAKGVAVFIEGLSPDPHSDVNKSNVA